MTDAELLALYDEEMRRNPAPLPDIRREEFRGIVRYMHERPGEHRGWIVYTHLDSATVDAAIEAQLSDPSWAGGKVEWKVYDHDTPANLKERLLAHGLQAEEPEALVVLDLADAPAYLWEPITADVRRITSADEIDAVMQVEEEVWGESQAWLGNELKHELHAGPERLSIYLAYADGQLASSAWIRFHPQRQFADLWGGSTRAAFRRRGLYTALVAVRAQEARARGVRFLTVDASPMSQPILEKIGFRTLTYTQPFVWGGVGSRE